MVDVELFSTYELSKVNHMKLENLIHHIFNPTQIDIELKERFVNPVVPHEWFLTPHFMAVYTSQRSKDETIACGIYDSSITRLVKRSAPPLLGELA